MSTDFFRHGYKDQSSKESQAQSELDRLCKLRKDNPQVTVLNKRGRAATNVKSTTTNKKGAVYVPKLTEGFIGKKLRILVERGVFHDDICVHNVSLVDAAVKMMYGDPSENRHIYENTVVAAASGYYLVYGETVFLHSDGSIFRVSATGSDVRCPCSRIHG
jgi:hypothetical protein